MNIKIRKLRFFLFNFDNLIAIGIARQKQINVADKANSNVTVSALILIGSVKADKIFDNENLLLTAKGSLLYVNAYLTIVNNGKTINPTIQINYGPENQIFFLLFINHNLLVFRLRFIHDLNIFWFYKESNLCSNWFHFGTVNQPR